MPVDSVIEERRKELEAELSGDITKSDTIARWTHRLAIFLMMIALGASGVAGAGGIAEFLPAKIVGGLALIPAGTAILVNTFKLQAKSSWHYRRSVALNSLRSRLRYQLPVEVTADQVARIAKDRDEINSRMQAEWEQAFVLNWTQFKSPPSHGS
jgi:hypothetical protein